jgi:hypothetical protein
MKNAQPNPERNAGTRVQLVFVALALAGLAGFASMGGYAAHAADQGEGSAVRLPAHERWMLDAPIEGAAPSPVPVPEPVSARAPVPTPEAADEGDVEWLLGEQEAGGRAA